MKLEQKRFQIKNLLYAFILFLLICYGCSSPKTKGDKVLIGHMLNDSSEDNGWGADLNFKIFNVVKHDTSTSYKVKTVYRTKDIGFEIEIPNNTTKDEQGLGEGIVINSLGPISDNLRNTLSNLYQLKTDSTRHFVKSIRVAYADLKQFAKYSTGTYTDKEPNVTRLKLFFDDPADTTIAEAKVFLNVLPAQHQVQLKEKDPEYRQGVIDYFTQKN